ncbi:MAG: cysteine desulfurase, partial [Clostridia bacterium]|nr:cysteine desulfurase [Clostridia bacterium]
MKTGCFFVLLRRGVPLFLQEGETRMQAYLDNSATTKPSEGVIREMAKRMSEMYYNPSSLYKEAFEVEKELNTCREEIRKAINAKDARVIFTSGGTESNNLALFGVFGVSRPPIRIAVSSVEHPSVLDAANALTKMGAEIVKIGVDEKGRLDFDQLAEELEKGLTLVSVMQVNNETGAITDVERLSGLVREKGEKTLLHIDGVQGFLRCKMDFHLCDLYTLSSHKIHGPKGVGALVVRKGVRLSPTHIGGGQEDALRSGTENTPGIFGLMQAIREMKAMTDMSEALMEKKLKLIEAFKAAVPELIINGPSPETAAPHIVNFGFPNVRGEVMLHALEEEGVFASTGSACSSKKMKVSRVLTEMGIPAKRAEWALRFSLSPYTTMDEINYAAEVVKAKYELL